MSVQIVRFETYDARGGPTTQEGSGEYAATPTRNGRFIIYSIGKHISGGKWKYSMIPWGASLRFNKNILEFKKDNIWIPITKAGGKWSNQSNNTSYLDVVKINNNLLSKVNGQKEITAQPFPSEWIFNDFGHVSIKYFLDQNGDGRLDGKESLMTDFIHTTPEDELIARYAKANNRIPNITLGKSHGCIHVKPNDIDSMIAKGYIAKGNVVQVHGYDEKIIPQTISIKKRISLFEAHFFPGLLKMVIYKAPIRDR